MRLLRAEFDCEVLTPMFLSGADQTMCELRAASLRGAMRFWYRAMLGGQGKSLSDVKAEEAKVFGESAREGGTVGASPVMVRVWQSSGLPTVSDEGVVEAESSCARAMNHPQNTAAHVLCNVCRSTAWSASRVGKAAGSVVGPAAVPRTDGRGDGAPPIVSV